jgi:hypothetical protein
MTKLSVMIGCLLASSLSPVFAADGEQTNCRIETVNRVAIYSGYTQCNSPLGLISSYVHPTTQQFVTISGFVNGGYSSCTAQVPFYTYENITREVCDYKPVAGFVVSQPLFSLVSNSTDSDGSIVKYEWWFNGVKQSGTGYKIPFPIPTGSASLNVKLKVTDNSGYTNELTKNVIITDDECTTAACRNR